MALSQAQDPAARASAMMALAGFVNVHEAVLLSLDGGKLTWQVWLDHAPGFSAPRDLGHDNPIEILNQIAPPRPVVELDPSPRDRPLPDKRWYLQTRVHIGVAATVVLAVIGGYLWAHYSEPPRPWDTNITTGLGPSK
jgi:hypothetical protein